MRPNIVPLSAAAQYLKVNKSQLQYYRNLGLIHPVEEFSNSRVVFYDLREVIKVFRIVQRMRKKGYSLEDIKEKIAVKAI